MVPVHALLEADVVLAPLLGSIATGNARSGFGMMLEMWMAGGLLRLAGNPSWRGIGFAAIILLIRKLVLFGLRHRGA